MGYKPTTRALQPLRIMKDLTQQSWGFSRLTLNHANKIICPTSLLYVVSGLPQTDAANTKWFLDYHELYRGTHALQGLQHTPSLGGTKYIYYEYHYKTSWTCLLINVTYTMSLFYFNTQYFTLFVHLMLHQPTSSRFILSVFILNISNFN